MAKKLYNLPVLVERDEKGFYAVDCPMLPGCYSQGKTFEEAIKNLKEVVSLILEEEESRKLLKIYKPEELGLHTLPVQVNA